MQRLFPGEPGRSRSEFACLIAAAKAHRAAAVTPVSPRAEAMASADHESHETNFRMEPGETLASIIEHYNAVAAYTDKLVETVDLDLSHPLPAAPWFPEGKTWSARRVFVHIVAETAQHAGHADILRETLDGQKSMG